MRLCCLDIYSPLQLWPIRSIEDKDGDNREGQETTKAVEDTRSAGFSPFQVPSPSLTLIAVCASFIQILNRWVSKCFYVVNRTHLASIPMNKHCIWWRSCLNPSVTVICVKVRTWEAGDRAGRGAFIIGTWKPDSNWIYQPQITNAHLERTRDVEV